MQAEATKPRRTSVKGHPGVYYRLNRHGERRYEIAFYDSTGRRVFETVDGNLDAADEALRERKQAISRGQRVVSCPRRSRSASGSRSGSNSRRSSGRTRASSMRVTSTPT